MILQPIISNMAALTRKDLMYVKKQKINKLTPDMILIREYQAGDDLEAVLSLINAAYKLEIGDSGLAFKKFDRLQSAEDIEADKLHLALVGEAIVGCIVIAPGLNPDSANIGKSFLEFQLNYFLFIIFPKGPLAVRSDLQGQGIGSCLLEYAESKHQETTVDVVSCRTDLEKFYHKRGYR